MGGPVSAFKAAIKVAQAAAAGVVAVKVAQNTERVVAAVDRGAAKLVRAGSERVRRAAERVREVSR